MRHAKIGVPRRRDEALAFIIDCLVKTGASPTYEEIAKFLGVGRSRAQELVEQLIAADIIEKVPGAQRALRVRDVVHARQITAEFARSVGWTVASPLGDLQEPPPHLQLPMLPPFEHLPEAE